MEASEFKAGMRVRLIVDCDLAASAHGHMALEPLVLRAGEIAVVKSAPDKFGDMALLEFDRVIPYPEDFGGPSRDVWISDPDTGSGLTFDQVTAA